MSNNQNTLVPELVDYNLAPSVGFYVSATNFVDVMGEYLAEIGVSVDYQRSGQSGDPIYARGQFYKMLEDTRFAIDDYNTSGRVSGTKQPNIEFIVYWIRRFNMEADSIRSKLNELVPNPTMFTSFSESIGQLARVNLLIDNSIIPMFNSAYGQFPVPTQYTPSVHNKINPNSQLVSKELSLLTGSVLRKNIQMVQGSVVTEETPSIRSFSSTSHGDNLVTDVSHWYRIQQAKTTILESIRSIFGELYDVIHYYSVYNPQDPSHNLQRASKSGVTLLDVEGSTLSVSMLMDRVKSYNKTVTVDRMLSVSRR